MKKTTAKASTAEEQVKGDYYKKENILLKVRLFPNEENLNSTRLYVEYTKWGEKSGFEDKFVESIKASTGYFLTSGTENLSRVCRADSC